MKPRPNFQSAGLAMPNVISAWPHPGFIRDGRRVFGFCNHDDGVMPLFYRQRPHERIARQRLVATASGTEGGQS